MIQPITRSRMRPVSCQSRVSSSQACYAEPLRPEFLSAVQMPTAEAPLVSYQPAGVFLDFEDLENFEVVRDQFQRWGIRFRNAIALHPSNPAFPPYSGSKVLMSAPHPGWLEVEFQRPVQRVGSHVTGSQRIRMVAVDAQQRTLVEAELASANLAIPGCELAPNQYLSLQAPAIHRIIFQALGGQLTLNDLEVGVRLE